LNLKREETNQTLQALELELDLQRKENEKLKKENEVLEEINT